MRARSDVVGALRASVLDVAEVDLPDRDIASVIRACEERGFAFVRAAFCREKKTKPPRYEGRCPDHLVWIRAQPCVVPGCLAGFSQAAHVRMNTGGGTGMKPPDRWTIPCCVVHHREQHRLGHRAFDAKYDIDSRDLATRFAALSPALKQRGTE